MMLNLLIMLSVILNISSYYMFNKLNELIKNENRVIDRLTEQMTYVNLNMAQLINPDYIKSQMKSLQYFIKNTE